MNVQRTLNVCAGVLAALIFVGAACAGQGGDNESPHVNGDYRFVITHNCVRTSFQQPPANGFNPETKQFVVPGEAQIVTGTGVLRLEQDGSLQVLEGRQTELSTNLLSPGQIPIMPPAEFGCTGSYTAQDDKLAVTLLCSVKVPEPGVTVTVSPQKFEGFIDQRRRILNLINIAGEIQSVTVAVAGNPVQQLQRICTQHAIGTR
jgi:hypothetical protein